VADSKSGYKVGPGRPPLHTRFKKGQSGNPGGRSTKSVPALLADALNETVVVTIDGRRRTITKREAAPPKTACSPRNLQGFFRGFYNHREIPCRLASTATSWLSPRASPRN